MFALTIPMTEYNLGLIKADLTRAMNEVKSSHRCEAIARGLGFRTYAALLAALKLSAPLQTSASGSLFADYLSVQGFGSTPRAFYFAVARVALREVLNKVPNLTRNGIGAGDRRRRPEGGWESASDRKARISAEQAQFGDDHVVEEFLASLAFLSRVDRTKTIREDISSYGIKHIAEKFASTYPEGDELGPVYISNGILIAAAVQAGFEFKTYMRGWDVSLNVCFNMSMRSLSALNQGSLGSAA